jgi:hypothetical protein
MGWIKVDDSFYDNDKMLAAGSIGRDLYWHGMGFCNRNLTDGLIPKARALTLVDFSESAVLVGGGGVDGQACAPIAVQRLLEAGLWHQDGHDCESCVQPGERHYVVHDYLDYQPSREQVKGDRETVRAKRADAGRLGGMRSGETRRSKNEAKTKQNGSKNEPPTPTPTPTKRGGELYEPSVTSADPNSAPPPCPRHQENSDAPCHDCRRIRIWEEQQHAVAAADELEAKRRARDAEKNCPICEGTNWVPETEPAIKCDHGLAVNRA